MTRLEFGSSGARYLRLWPQPYASYRGRGFGLSKYTRAMPLSERHWVGYATRTTFVVGNRRWPVSRYRIWNEGTEMIAAALRKAA